MISGIRHRTTYKYGNAVDFARCVLKLTPVSSGDQTLLENRITVTPRPSKSVSRIGPFGEQTRTVTLEHTHRTLVVEAVSRVDVHRAATPEPATSPTWETVRELSLEATSLAPDSPALYLFPTARTPILPQVTAYTRTSFPVGRPVMEAAADLMNRIRKDMTYDPDATTVSTPAAEAFASRSGVCQDFAHIMICGLKGLGLPAAYVSGYLRTIPPPGKPRLQGADATHAWVSLWCGPDEGWIGFDPTNALIVRNDHIVLAVGRDYSDVAPIDGVMLSPGKQAIQVEVDVIPEDLSPAMDQPAVA